MRDVSVPAGRPVTRADLVPVVARERAAEFPRTIPFEHYHDGAWRPVTMGEVVRRVDEIASGLVASGVLPGDRVALMAATRLEWVLVDMAVWTAGAISVPVYPSSSAAQLQWILEDSAARVLVAEGDEHAAVVAAAEVPATCETVVYLDDGGLEYLEERGHDVDPQVLDDAIATLGPDTPASIVYTSGTTGLPKGCVLTHANLLAECHGLLDHPIGTVGRSGNKTLMFLPLAHVLARSVTYTMFLGGATTGFWADTSTLLPRLADFRPHMILGVPRVFEKVRDGIAAQARAKGRIQQEIFGRAEQVAIDASVARGGDGLGDAREPSLLATARYRAYDLAVYRAVRAALGGRCEYAISGGGALPDRIAHFFRGLGVPIYEGYGLTESHAAATVNGPGCQRIGTVGRPLAGMSVRIADSGEIELSGPLVFSHYWNNESATAEVLRDGWFSTGDLGELDADGYLRITGRKKELIVTGGGKNVAPGPLEDAMRSHRLVGHAVVIGESRKFISALVAVDEEALARWAEENDHEGVPPEQLVEDPALRAEIQYAVDEANSLVSHAEEIKKFTVLPRDFTEARGELTPTLKLKRHVIDEVYAEQIEALYR